MTDDSELRRSLPLFAVPWLVVTNDGLRALPLDARAGFVVSLIDGKLTRPKPFIAYLRTILRAAMNSGHLDKLPNFPAGLMRSSHKLPDAPSASEISAMLGAPGWLGLAVAFAAMARMRMGGRGNERWSTDLSARCTGAECCAGGAGCRGAPLAVSAFDAR